VSIEGCFSLGWIGRLTPEQLEFVGLLLKNRGNVQKLAAELNIAYNTARNRFDDIVEALGAPPQQGGPSEERERVLEQLAADEIDFDKAMELLEDR